MQTEIFLNNDKDNNSENNFVQDKIEELPACCWICEHCLNYSVVYGQYFSDICDITLQCVEITDDEKPYAFRMSWCPLEKRNEKK